VDETTGAIDQEKLRTNIELAMEVYINRVNNSPCGDTQIHLFKGANSTEFQEQRQSLLIFLKLACIKAWVNEHAYNGEYTDILITMTRK